MITRRPRRRIPVAAAVILWLLALVAAGVIYGSATNDDDPPPALAQSATGVAPLPVPLGLRVPWNGRAFINDNLWTAGDYQFAVWVDPDGRPIVGRRDSGAGDWRTTDLGRLPGNPLGAPTAVDEHHVYAVAVDVAGYVHVAGNMHSTQLRYIRSERPFDIDGWQRGIMVGTDEDSVSYPAFVRAPGGSLLFFYRAGAAGDGDVVLNRLDAPSRGWQRVATLIDGRSSDESPYLQHVAVDPVRRAIHVMFVWRPGREASGNRDLSYLRSDDDGTTWRRSDGTPAPLPVTHADADVVLRSSNDAPLLLNQGGLAVDAAGRPHTVFREREGSQTSGVLHVWQDGAGWRSRQVSDLGEVVGRPALVGTGSDPLLILWTAERSGDRSELRVARLEGGQASGTRVLAELPVQEWEPTFDSVALVERRQLRILLPVRREPKSRAVATGAVATWSVSALAE